MFHHFPELPIKDNLVASTDLSYAQNPTATYLTSVSRVGYALENTNTSYIKKSFPPVSLTYSLFPSDDDDPENLVAQEVDKENLETLSIGVDGSSYKWVDLDGQGLPGILSEQEKTWYFKRNTSANAFEQKVPRLPTQGSLPPLHFPRSRPLRSRVQKRPFLETSQTTPH